MIKYYVSTVDRYNGGPYAGQIVTGSPWSCEIAESAESYDAAIRAETEYISGTIEDDYKCKQIDKTDLENGMVYWCDHQNVDYVTEVSIDFIEEI